MLPTPEIASHFDKNPLVALHIRHDKTQILEVCFIPLTNAFTRGAAPSLHMRLIPLHEPKGRSGLRSMQHRAHDNSFLYRKWGGFDQVEARTMFESWCEGVLRLPDGKKIIPVCYGWYRYAHLMEDWLGCTFNDMIHTTVRDIELIHAFYLDRTAGWGKVGKPNLNFNEILRYFDVDCLDNNSIPIVAVAIAEVYRRSIFKSLA